MLALLDPVREQLNVAEAKKTADQLVQLADLPDDVADTQAPLDAAIAAHAPEVGDSDGILARLAALGGLHDGDSMLAAAHWLVFLFMTALECLPIIFKTMLALAPPSLYERLVLLDEEKVEQRMRLRLQTEYEEAETLARSALAAAEARAARTLEAESRATGMVLDAQLDVTRDGVRRWRDEQLGATSAPGEAPSADDLESLYADDGLGPEDPRDGRLAGSSSAPA